MGAIADAMTAQAVKRFEEEGLSVRRYNRLVREAYEECKRGGDIEKAKVLATLALAEATILSDNER